MRRIVLRADDGGIGVGAGAGVTGAAASGVTLILPESRGEYDEARAEVASLLQAAGGNEVTGPADGGPDGRGGTYAMPGADHWVVTTGEQRRTWDLPDLAEVATVPAFTRDDLQRAWRRDVVPLVDADDAVRLLAGHGAGRRVDDAGADGRRAFGPVQPEHAGEFVNLKHGRGPIPAHVRETFDELSGRSRIDALVDSLDEVLGPLERETLPRLQETRRELTSLRPLLQRELAPERLHAPRGAGPRAGGALNLGGGLHPLLRRARRAAAMLELLDSSVLPGGEMSPSRIVQFLEQADHGVLDAAEMDAGAGRVDAALAACDKAVGQVIERLRALFDARPGIRKGGWDDADVRRAVALVRRVEELRGKLDDAGASEKQVDGLRTDIKAIEDDRESVGRLGPRVRETLRRLEAMDLPAVVLDKALEELRVATTSGYESATASLERVRLLAALPWSRRARERTDTAGAMRELDDAHEGRHEIKERIRRFLAVRALQQAAWTLEGSYGLDGAPDGDRADCVPLRRIVVRNVRAPAAAPVLCFGGPPGTGKTSLAKRIATALGRPAVTIALGGVWDEAQIRGLSIAFRSPEPGRIVKGLEAAGVRNPVFVLDEVDKVAQRGSGDPAAALLEVLDPQQNHAFRDNYVDVPVDLSEVLFIATANRLETVPAPLRDRLEVIQVPGYSAEEKLPIVRRHLLPRQIEAGGLRAGRLWAGLPEAAGGAQPGAASEAAPVEMTDTAIRALIRGHTCEAGVRQLERLVEAVCQHVACRRVAAADAAPVTVAGDAREAERLEAQARRCVTIEELFGTPRNGSLPDEVRDAVSREWECLLALHPADPEAAAARDWIEVVEDLPWGRPARGRTEATELRRRLDAAYVGRGEEKEQVLDHLAARGLTRPAAERSTAVAGEDQEADGADRAVLCFWGPHGIGRTAFAAAVAAALGRRCVRVSLAGAADAGAVRGVARSSREPAPGRIVTALRQGGQPHEGKRPDPVCILGGIDRMQDAAAHALLDMLDPVRSRAFRDRYVGLPLDLSAVTWVATATDPSEIPMPLLERLELVALEEYAEAEKLRIATEHLLPRQLRRHGLAPDDLSLPGEALRDLVRGYTHEPGVFGLDRRIGALCRRAARRIAEGGPAPGAIGPDALVRWYGEPPYRGDDVAARTRRPGVAVGLAATAAGGSVLFVEARAVPGRGRLRVTGGLGPLATESAIVALTWVRDHADRLASVDAGFDRTTDVHVHLPAGGSPKDGVSAGVTIAAALVSALTGQRVHGGVAMTGELTLSGAVARVGGIRPKVLAACREGVTSVILPQANRQDLDESFGGGPPSGLDVQYAVTMDDVLTVALPDVLG